MIRYTLALVASLALTVAVRAADLPTGTWAVNVDGNKGDLVIKEVKAGQVTGVMLGTDFTGTWREKTLTFTIGELRYEAQLVSEPGDAGKTKYTLTGTREENVRVPSRVAFHKVKTGWYAQITAEAPVVKGEIKAEVRGVLVYEESKAYVSVKKDSTTETRVWFLASDGASKNLQQTLSEFNGKEVIVTGYLAQMVGKDAAIPNRAMYFLGKFDIKLAK